MAGYTPLFNSIVTSSVWNEDSETRIVWITLLALADAEGKVEGSISGLAPVARVPLKACEKALERLKAPDKYSRTEDFEGRRITETEGGWLILNHQRFRERAKSRAEYYRKYRQRKKEENNKNSNINTNSNSATAHNNRTVAQRVVFEEARTAFPGTKRGFDTEYNNFTRKHKDWRNILPLLKPAIKAQIADRQRKKITGEFVPSWKHFRTWINNRCWEEETPIEKPVSDLQPAICIIDHKPAYDYKPDGARQPIWLCLDCIRALGGQDWGEMSKSEIEKAVEQGRRRPPPVVKDPELATQAKKQAAVAKLTTKVADKMAGESR